MSRTKEYLAQAIDAWRNDGVSIPNDVALYLIEELALVNKTRGGVRQVRDVNTSRDVVDATDAVFGWMVAGGVRQITAEVYDHLRAEYARAQNARVEAAGNTASLTLPDVTIDTQMSDAAAERTLAIVISTQHRVAIILNDGTLYEGDPNVDDLIPVPEALLAELEREYPPAQPQAHALTQLLDLYRKAVAR